MDTPGGGPDKIREQNNYSGGTFIGGDHHGDIHNEVVDPNTKALLAKMTKQSPALAKLLTKALRDGVISPDIVSSLAWAARNINEDVAFLLDNASRCINHDVAELLTSAGSQINPDVARQLTGAANTLEQAAAGFNIAELTRLVSKFEEANTALSGTAGNIKRSLSDLTGDIDRLGYPNGPLDRLGSVTGALSDAAGRIEKTVTPPPPERYVDRGAELKAFFWGLGIGAVFILYLWHQRG
ncbi:hypothetical protein ACIOUE_37940 [Streptomyces xanthochromogenes]|uniref:hypothetical protein n=1 Tax=Streptomyces xanthochromogenes TaxID=67384 RepID=UPI00381E2D2B